MDRISIKDITNGAVTDPAAVKHIAKALRLKPGGEFIAYDGKCERRLRVLGFAPGEVQVEELSSRSLAPVANITVAQCLIKGRGWDFFLEKATELGVARILPAISSRTIVRIEAHEIAAHLERWRRVAASAAAQCAGCAPEILPPAQFAGALEQTAHDECRIVLCFADCAMPFRDALPAGASGATLLLGPEGDFSPAEISAAVEAGFTPAHIGPRILRSETAAITAIALALELMGALSTLPKPAQ